ncbi:hypothetical protein H4R20_001607 [Coemansia guatemalensis]|uniref:Uncharacterized protein n=1 Tax=Coemansia guatemalensis TaxID=2761395 RepID=A0A9W8HZ98_9FUNG|nr:hypothetical protein H4R20_001607 [Coemansia guatemalensis]
MSSGLETIQELKERARASNVEISERVCLDMSRFKAVLHELRRVDDNIMLRMNTTNTADADDCKALFAVLQTAYARREHDIRFCVDVLDRKIDERKKQNSPSFSLQTQRDWINNELSVENIVRRRSLDVFKSRCPFIELPEVFVEVSGQKK